LRKLSFFFKVKERISLQFFGLVAIFANSNLKIGKDGKKKSFDFISVTKS